MQSPKSSKKQLKDISCWQTSHQVKDHMSHTADPTSCAQADWRRSLHTRPCHGQTALLAALKSWPASSTWDPLCATATHCPILAQNHSWLPTVGRSGQGTELSGTAGMGGTKSQKNTKKIYRSV